MPFRFRGKFQIIPPQKLTLKQTCRGKMILLLLLKKLAYYLSHWGKIQGDGRKFLDRFKSYSGSQISSQSLNEVHIYQLQPKPATKGDLFHIFLSLNVSSWSHGLQMVNEANEVLLGKRPR